MNCIFYPRSHLGSSSDLRFSVVEGQDGHYSTTVIRRAQKGRLSALRDDPNKVPSMCSSDGSSHTHKLIRMDNLQSSRSWVSFSLTP